MTVTYFDNDDNEMQCIVSADDEACAIGVVLDQLGEDIAPASPFAVWREHEPKTMGRKGTKAKLISGPVLHVDEDEAIPTQELPNELAVVPTAEVKALLESVQSETGVGLEQS
jgi:hypothetical protein